MTEVIHDPMSYHDACKEFRTDILPQVKREYERDGAPDYPARAEAWNNWTDFLCKEGYISTQQYEEWSAPEECSRPKS